MQEQPSGPQIPAGKDGGDNNAAIGGGIAAAVALAVGLAVLVTCVLIRRCSRRRGDGMGVDALTPACQHTPQQTCTPQLAPYVLSGKGLGDDTSGRYGAFQVAQPTLPALQEAAQLQNGQSGHGARMHDAQWPESGGLVVHEPGSSGNEGCGTSAGWSDVQPYGADSDFTGITSSAGTATTMYYTSLTDGKITFAQQKARLITELDHMRRHDELFLGQYAVLPWTERREGGQGVVQFMRSTRAEEFVAVKFFLSETAYDTEMQLYEVDVLRSMMPEIRMELRNVDAAERSNRGYAWPPCIVLEKGESLQEWKARTQPAFSTILDVRPCCKTSLFKMPVRWSPVRLLTIATIACSGFASSDCYKPKSIIL